MKNLVTCLALILGITVLANAQEPTREEWKKMNRSERKEYKQKKAEEKMAAQMKILESKNWVLEANTLQDRYGNTYQISSNLNFVAVSEDMSVVQLGDNDGVGYNGVGGITVEGKTTKYEIIENEKNKTSASLNLMVQGAAMGHVTMLVFVSANGNASAQLTTMEGDRLTYNGKIVPIHQSRVYQGTTLF